MGTSRAARSSAPEGTLRSEAEVRARIDAAVADADFTDVPLPDFAAVLPDPRRLSAALASRAALGIESSAPLHVALDDLSWNLDSTR